MSHMRRGNYTDRGYGTYRYKAWSTGEPGGALGSFRTKEEAMQAVIDDQRERERRPRDPDRWA